MENLDLNSLKTSIERAKWLIREALEGNKPRINSDKNGVGEDGWLLLMLRKMHEEHLIPENAEEYVSFGDSISEGLTGYNPVADRVVKLAKETTTTIRKLELETTTRVLGNLIRVGLFNAEKWKKIGENADVFVLPNKGDLYSVYEFLHVLEEKINQKTDNTQNLAFKPIIAINEEEVYNELFNFLYKSAKADKKEGREELLASLSITITNKNKAIKKLLPKIAEGAQINNRNTTDEPSFNLPEKTLIVVATTSDEKLLQAQIFFAQYGIPVISLTDLVGIFPDGKELHLTYEGNAVGLQSGGEENSGKAYTILEFLQKKFTGDALKNKLETKLKDLGYDKYKLILYANDQGVEVPKKVMAHFDYSNTEFIPKSEYKKDPGPEFTWFVQAKHGMEALIKAVNEAMDKANYKSRKIVQVCVSAFIKLNVEEPMNSKIMTTCGKSSFILERNPIDNNGLIQSESFFAISTGARVFLEVTYEKYVRKYSAVGHSLKAFFDSLGIKKINPENLPHVAKEDFGIVIYGKDKLLKNSLEEEGYKVVDTEKDDGGILDFEENYLSQADCIVFTEPQDPTDSITTVLRFFDTIVAKQTDPRDINKPLIVYQPGPALNLAIQLYNQLYSTSYSKEYPLRLIKEANDSEELQKLIDKQINSYLPSPETYDYSPVPSVRDSFPDNEHWAFIACSASSNRDNDIDSVNKLVNSLLSNGINILYGGSDHKMMGQVLNAVMEWRKENPEKEWMERNPNKSWPKIVASSTANLLKRETLYGREPVGLDDFIGTETIYRRMEGLTILTPSQDGTIQPVELQAILRGGPGTVQEALILIPHILKNPELFENYKMVIDNQPINGKNPYALLQEIIKLAEGHKNYSSLAEKIVFTDTEQGYEEAITTHLDSLTPNHSASDILFFTKERAQQRPLQ